MTMNSTINPERRCHSWW